MLYYRALRGGAVVARRAHNPKVAGSNPAPATSQGRSLGLVGFALFSNHISGRRSSAVEQAAHNRRVTGSNPVAAILSPPFGWGFLLPDDVGKGGRDESDCSGRR